MRAAKSFSCSRYRPFSELAQRHRRERAERAIRVAAAESFACLGYWRRLREHHVAIGALI
jgi:hypothetical protein